MHSRRRRVRRIPATRPFRHAQAWGATRYTTGMPGAVQAACHPEVKIRRIREDGQVGFALLRRDRRSFRYSP